MWLDLARKFKSCVSVIPAILFTLGLLTRKLPFAGACYGSGPASRFGDLTAGLLSFELDCAADFLENPGSAIC